MALRDGLMRTVRALPRAGRDTQQSYYGGLTSGGITNYSSGMGTSLDKAEDSFFLPTRFFWSTPLEVLVVQSWVARNFINIPVMDMFIRWREWVGDDASVAAKMAEVELKHKVTDKLAKAMKSARQYGTAVIVLMTKEAPLTAPLNMNRIRPGDLTNLLVLNRYELTVPERQEDMRDSNFGMPEFYDLHPHRGAARQERVHHSRLLRFDGIEAGTDSGFISYEWDWGISALVPLITSLLQDATVAAAAAHLTQEASIPVLKSKRLREAVSSKLAVLDPKVMTPEQIGRQINRSKSIWRLFMLDKDNEEFERVEVNLAGWADLLDKFPGRVAAAAQIPQTRFMGRSPAGMNATGESDMDNYIMMMEAERARMLPSRLKVLDEVLARDAGIKMVPDFEWRSLLELGDKEKAEAFGMTVTGLTGLVQCNIMDEDEAREAISGHPMVGVLEGPAPEPELDPDDMPIGPDGKPVTPPAKPPVKSGGDSKNPKAKPPKPKDS